MLDLGDVCLKRVGTFIRRKYKIDRMHGYGASAAVYAATHRNGKQVSLKILHPELAGFDDVRNRFLREAYVANRIAHPGVVRIDDDDDDDDNRTVFLVMELLEGITLQASLDALGGKLPLNDAIQCASGVLDVLAAAHDLGIVHRDLKPENIFLCRTGLLKVLDFGIARVTDFASATRSGQILGTPGFMAPEQASGRTRDADARTDVYAVGAVMFRMLAGREVHDAANPTIQLVYAATQPAPALLSVGALVPASVAAVVDRALKTAPDARWPSAREMRDALASALPHSALRGTMIHGSG